MYIGLNNLGLNYVTKAFSPASVFNVDSTGLWVEAYNPNSLYQRRNLFTYSEDFTNAIWYEAGAGTWTATDANTIDTGAVGSVYVAQNIVVHPGSYTIAVTASITAGSGNIKLYVAGGLAIFELTATPTRYEYTAVVTASGTVQSYFELPNSATVVLDEAQVERGSTATTYQKVTDWYTEYIDNAQNSIAMWQDAVASAPVTAVNHTVGMWLDKSHNLQFDAPVVTLTGTSSGSWTTSNASLANSSGELLLTCTTAGTFQATYTIPTTAGSMYRITADVRRGTAANAANIGFAFIGSTFTNSIESTTLTITLPAPGATLDVQIYGLGGSIGETLYFNNIVVQRMQGSYLAQTTSGSRPTLSARVNLLTKTEQFDDSPWVSVEQTVSANVAAAPDGTITAAKITETDVVGLHQVYVQYTSFAVGTRYRWTIHLKKGTRTWAWLNAQDGTDNRTWVNLDTGEVGTNAAGNSATVANVGNGWWRLVIERIAGAASGYLSFGASPADGVLAHMGSADYFYVWGADLRTAISQPAYQRVNTDTDYDTDGFAHYLSFDGIDDSIESGAFSAGTLSADMDCFMLIRRYDDSRSLLGTDSSFDHYFACFDSGVTDVADSLVGAPTYCVNGTIVPKSGGITYRDDLADALPIGEWAVLEVRDLDLSAFLSFEFSSYGATWFFSGDLAGIVLCQAQSDSVRTQIRRYLGNKVGLSL